MKDAAGAAAPAAAGSFHVAIASSGNVSPIDPSFNAGNPVVTGFVTEAVSSDGDGKILVAGHQGDPAADTGQSVLQRLNSDGSLDTFFGAGGQVISDATNDAFFAVTSDTTGRIVAAGRRGSDLLVQRFRPNGAPDRHFGAARHRRRRPAATPSPTPSPWRPTDRSSSPAVRPAARASSSASSPSGKLDPSFGAGGVFTLPAGGAASQSAVTGLAVEPDGSVAAAGTRTDSRRRRQPASSPCASPPPAPPTPTFGPAACSNRRRPRPAVRRRRRQGRLRRPAGRQDPRRQPDGRRRLRRRPPQRRRLAPTPTFGAAGLVDHRLRRRLPKPTASPSRRPAQIYVVGTLTSGAATGQIAVAAYNPDGSPLVGFDGTGTFTAPPAVTTAAGAAAGSPAGATHAYAGLQHDGRLLVGATDESTAVATASCLRRLNVTGSGQPRLLRPGRRRPRQRPGSPSPPPTAPSSPSASRAAAPAEPLYDGQSVSLTLTGTGPRSALSVTTKNAPAPLALGDVRSRRPARLPHRQDGRPDRHALRRRRPGQRRARRHHRRHPRRRRPRRRRHPLRRRQQRHAF